MTTKSSTTLILVFIIFLYLLTRWFNLTALPVFADEAIYIRWAQLIIDEPLRYALFPLNDGKTPLFIWMLVPVLQVHADPLFMARMISVVAGAAQGVLLYLVMRQLITSRVAGVLAAIIGLIMPIWFFHQRMALMDAWLTVWISLTLFAVLKIFSSPFGASLPKTQWSGVFLFVRQLIHELLQPQALLWMIVGGVAFGAALLTKIPAILAAPSLAAVVLYRATSWRTYVLRLSAVVIVVGIGGAVFLLLKLHPAFSQLFARGGDFLHPISAVLFDGVWKVTLAQTLRLLGELYQYLGSGFIALLIASLFFRHKRLSAGLVLSGLLFTLPIFALGQVVYLRYLLPSMVFFTLAAGIGLFDLWTLRGRYRLFAQGLSFVVVFLLLWTAAGFMMPAYQNPDALRLPQSDMVQYQTEWSSGHGVKEVTQRLLAESQNQTVYLATEGYFGTLPDGVLLYLHQENVERLKVEGIGQPVGGFSAELKQASEKYDVVWLVVNSHRLTASIPDDHLVAEYCRPFNAPCLQLWDITSVLCE